MPEAHMPTCRDEVGLVRAIVVKVWIMHLAGQSVANLESGAFIFEAKGNVENNPN
jgi:hypothetical protein